MKKTYVLDTNVLLSNPEALFSFEENEVVIPEAVLEELDNKKTAREQIGMNAREVARKLYSLKDSCSNLFDGIQLQSGGMLYIESADNNKGDVELPSTWDSKKRDNDILKTCKALIEKGKNVTLVTKDIFLGIKADALEIPNEDFRTDSVVSVSEQYKGILDIVVNDDDFESYLDNGYIDIAKTYVIEHTDDTYNEVYEYEHYPNEYVILHRASNYDKSTALGKISRNGQIIDKLKFANEHPFGVTPRNAEQVFMQEALMTSVKEAPLVIIKGPAGTAKTFYSLACGLEYIYEEPTRAYAYKNSKKAHKSVLTDDKFRKILVCRPNQTMEEDIGCLPGTEKEKISPLMRPIYDNLEVLVVSDKEARCEDEEALEDRVQEIFDRKLIDTQAVGYLRGRSIESHWVIIDECFTGENAVLVEGDVGYSFKKLYKMYQNNEKLPNVVSYNLNNKQFELKSILNVVNKGKREVIDFVFGNTKARCTSNHPYLTFNGWVQAKDLNVGDVVLTTNSDRHQRNKVLNDDQYQIMLGSYLGDGSLQLFDYGNKCRMKITHGEKQFAYLKWKANMFGKNITIHSNGSGYSDNDIADFTTQTFAIKYCFDKENYQTHIPQWVIDDLDYRGIAIWVMDDGSVHNKYDYFTISTHAFDKDSVERLSNKLLQLGIENHIDYRPKNTKDFWVISIPKNGAKILKENIKPYIHESMLYKIHNEDRKMIYRWNNIYETVGAVTVKSKTLLNKEEVVYDIEVADNHNFAVVGMVSKDGRNGIYNNTSESPMSGIIVHNCQNLTANQAKAIVTRAGEGTKIIFCGDPMQIDNQYVTEKTNGLSYLAENMKGSPLVHIITTNETDIVRSDLAKEAVKYLERKEEIEFD